MTENTPTTMGDYAVLGVLGAGGMGRVYKVRNVITDRVEAIKVLLPDLQGHEEVAARFLREIKLVAGLTHPNIAGLHTALTINNQLVMVMEYVEGEPLSARLAAGALPVPDALNYIEQVLNALSYAHEKKIIHRDIKPANMMLTPQGIIKLMDFGIARTDSEPAKLTATGTTLGSINYMSPEQVKGSPVDERSDIYSVGISLYEMVTGEKPFHGDSNFSIMAAHINQAPTPPIDLHPDLPPGLNEIILTAIAKAPEERFQSAEAFSNAIRSVLNSVQDSRTMVQGSMNTVIADTAARAQLAPTAPITARSTIPVARPMPVAVAPMPAAQPSSHRGLYISLGALIVLVALLAAGLYMPSRKKTSAAGEPSSQPPAQVAQPVTPTSEAPVAAAPVETTPPVESTEPTVETPKAPVLAAKKLTDNTPHTAAAASPSNEAAAAQAAAAKALEAELDQIEKELDQLTSRAGAVNSSLDNLKNQQGSMGLGLRGDMAAKQSSMKNNLAKAQDAISRNDAERAKRYTGLAEKDIEALEKFLGR